MSKPRRLPPGITQLPSGHYQYRWRDPDGNPCKKTLPTLTLITAFKTKIEASKLDGTYLDLSAGRMLLGDYATEWLENRVCKDNTADRVESQVRVHIIPRLGHKPLSQVRPSDVQGFISALNKHVGLAPGTIENIYWTLQGIFTSAVNDARIAKTPCVDIKRPRKPPGEVVPPTHEQVGKQLPAMPDRYRIAGMLAAGAGLRQGEALGLGLHNVDFLRRQLVIDRQLITPKRGEPHLDDPKWGSVRTIPISDALLEALAAHIEAFPPVPVPLMYQGKPVHPERSRLLVTYEDGRPVKRNRFGAMWRQSLARADGFEFKFHDLRHYYASVLLEAGRSVRRVSKLLGHASVNETWKTYAHIIPDDGEGDAGVRSVIDAALRGVASTEVVGEPRRGMQGEAHAPQTRPILGADEQNRRSGA